MKYICYDEHNFRDSTLCIINDADDILHELDSQDFTATIRQIYYIFIGRDLFPDSWIDDVYNAKHGLPLGTKNTIKNYKRLGGILGDGRLAGLLPWDVIVDRGRKLESNPHWDSPEDVLRACADQFRYNLWDDQEHHVEVWLEKQTLIGVAEKPCIKLDVSYTATKGYNSLSTMWESSKRLIAAKSKGKVPVIIQVSDHDPSGIHMEDDINDRLHIFGLDCAIDRVALTRNQVNIHHCPPNPAKLSDPRAKGYIKQFGVSSWELEALAPMTLSNIIEQAIEKYIERSLFDKAIIRQIEARQKLEEIADNYNTLEM